MYKVSITGRAEKDLRRLDRQVKNRVVAAIAALADEPRPMDVEKCSVKMAFGGSASVIGESGI